MSQHQKENIISLISLVTVSTVYILYIFQRFLNSTFTPQEELKYWASAILLIIAIRLVLQAVLFVIFKISEVIMSNGKISEDVKDERDRIIEIKGDWISNVSFIIGFIFAMLAIVFYNITLSAMFAIIFVAGYIAELVGIFAKIYFYNRGVK